MALPAYDQCIKASHVFNLLDARGVISVTERQSYILRVRELAKGLRRSLDAHRSGQGGLMPELLLELFSEEIPARMQAKAADDLRRMVTDRLVAEGLVYEGAKAFATPRRLALTVHGIPARQPDLKEERKGPRVGGPDAAIAGFLKATGLASLEEAKIQRDPKKGDFYVALIEKPGRATLDVLADILPVIIRTFPWPKSMRWGERSARPGALHMGAAAACDRRHLRPGDRRAGCGEVCGRRHRGRPDHVRPSLHGAGGDLRAPLRGLRGQTAGGQGRARSGARARTSFSPTPSSWRSRKDLNWSRIRCCSTKSRAWSNGRWC